MVAHARCLSGEDTIALAQAPFDTARCANEETPELPYADAASTLGRTVRAETVVAWGAQIGGRARLGCRPVDVFSQ